MNRMGVKGKTEKEDKSEHSVLCDHIQITKKNIFIVDLEKRRQGGNTQS